MDEPLFANPHSFAGTSECDKQYLIFVSFLSFIQYSSFNILLFDIMWRLQQAHGFADFRWQDWMFCIIGIAICIYMFLFSPKIYPWVIARFEKKHRVTIKARFRSYKIEGPHPGLYLAWLELKLLLTLFAIYFSPLVLIGLLGLILGVFE